ncbi:MAG TPA: M28 family peptidase [Nannocystis exedens]|nr:M28 family peptidase [Nannocystis exedens]
MTRSPAPLALALLVFAALLLAVRADLETPSPAGAAAKGFSSERARSRLVSVLGDERAHPMGSAAGHALALRIAAILRVDLEALSTASKPEIQVAQACGRRSAVCGQVHNVVVRIPGSDPDAGAILLSAHHDSVAAGPGAGDDGSGVAVLLELAYLLAHQDGGPGLLSRRRPLVLLFVDGEEHGLIGAQAFLQGHRWAKNIAFAINLDAGGNDGLATLTRTSAGNGPAIAALAETLRRPRAASVTATAYALTPYDTDFSAYDRAGIFSLDFGIGEDKAPYHTPNDRIRALDRGSLQHLGETALAAIAALDGLEEGVHEGAGDRVYLDLAGRTLLTLPAWSIPWIAAVLFALQLAILRRLRPDPVQGAPGQHLARPEGITLGARVWGLQVFAATAGGAALAWLMAFLAGAEMASYADPLRTRVALWAAVTAISAAIAVRSSRWLGAAELWAGTWAALALLTLVLAAIDPGASVALLPVVAAQVILAGVAVLYSRGRLPTYVLLLGLVVPGFLWFQAALRVELLFGLGRHGAAIALAPVALLAALLGPLWVWAPRWLQRVGLGLASALALMAALASVFAPAHSPERARRLNLVLHRDADSGQSRWLVGDRPGPLPPALRAVVPFSEAPAQSFPWSADDDESWIATAADVDLPAPKLELLSDEAGPWGRLLRLRLTSPRGARRAALLFSEDAGVRAFAFAQATVGPYPPRKLERYPEARHYGLIGVPLEGIEVRVIVAAEGPITVDLWDIADGLPDDEQSRSLLAARPADHVPSGGGDLSLVSRRVTLGDE